MRIRTIAVAIMGVLLLTTTPAMAAPRPQVKFAFSSGTIEARTPAPFRYSSAHLPGRSVIVLQQRAPRGWQNVKNLVGGKGTDATPGLSAGRYAFRLRAVHVNSTVATSAVRYLTVKAAPRSYQVPLATLCADDFSRSIHGNCHAGTIGIGATAFSYAYTPDNASYPNFYQGLRLNATTCSLLTLRFGAHNEFGTYPTKSYLRVVQDHGPVQAAQTSYDEIGTLTATLNGGPFMLQNASDNIYGFMYANGVATCTTSNGLPA